LRKEPKEEIFGHPKRSALEERRIDDNLSTSRSQISINSNESTTTSFDKLRKKLGMGLTTQREFMQIFVHYPI
jgi:hypothetical protein